ncbi:MAG: recombinase family protein [Clostridiaceae bacterium]|uniref:recombinase family protein n=1 Tax=Clostridium porci TaxID=2605778 RepID=UPI002A849D54|nr:recombinase family protein [Clostridiaceae bacterium]
MQNVNSGTTTYNAVAYVRVSKEDIAAGQVKKTESNSISNQKKLISDFVKDKQEINIVSVRTDDGYTGTNYDRPAFQLMLDDIRAGRINCVIVKDLSRFGREYIDAGKYIDRLFPYYGVRLIAINDNIDTITKDMSDELGITIRNLFNDNYCRDISIKTRSSLKVKRKNGEFTGAFVAYGYRRSDKEHNNLMIDEYPASVVQDIFKWKLAGMSQDGIARKLNEQGILSPLEYKRSLGMNYKSGFKVKEKAVWTSIAVRRILTNELYVGTLIQGIRTTPNHKVKTVKVNDKEDWCILENNHEPIVSQKTFNLVQRLLALDTRTSPNKDVVFSLCGLVVCGDCGNPMVRKVTTAKGKKYSYYVCSRNKDRSGCSSHRIKTEDLETAVLRILQNHIRVVVEMWKCLDFIEKLPFRQINLRKAEERLLKIEEEISRYRKLKITLYEDMKEGIVTKEDYVDISVQYEQRIKDAEQAAEQIHKEIDTLMGNSTDEQRWMKDFIQYKNLTQLTRIAAVELIEKIHVFENKKIVVEFLHAQDFEKLMHHLSEYKKAEIIEKEAI